MRDIWTIAKRELRATFSDKASVIAMLITPFVLIFGFMMMTSMMGTTDVDEDYKAVGYYINAPEYFIEVMEEIGLENLASNNDVETIKSGIENEDCDVLIAFPEDFSMDNPEKLSDIEIWYNSTNMESTYAYSVLIGILDSARPVLFTINANDPESYDLGGLNIMEEMLALSFPLYSIMGIFMGCLNIAADSIAGDKERGFMNLLLIAPTKRRRIAFGKSLSIFCINIASAISVMLGLSASVIMLKNMDMAADLAYSFVDYASLFASAVCGAFAMTGVVLICSTVATSVKQSQTLSTSTMMILMVCGILSNTESGADIVKSLGTANALIPLWNAVSSMQNIIHGKYEVVDIIISCAINLGFVLIATMTVAKMFDDEKIMQSN